MSASWNRIERLLSIKTQMSCPPTFEDLAQVPHFSCFQLDPINDPRWAHLVASHPKASVFHTVAWLRALRRTYEYEPVVFTTSPPGVKLRNGLVFCRINSWLTGRRLVSLPFSDHCEPLCDDRDDLNFLIQFLQTAREHQKWKYLQMRPLNARFDQPDAETGFLPSDEYYFHSLDLSPNLDQVFKGLDRNSVQRRIQRAERADLIEKCARSQDLLREFYSLFLMTRRRQRVPPTPYAWFRNLVDDMGQALEIRVAFKDDNPIAAILTLEFRDVVYYKYGCSDARFNKYGAAPWLFWKAITSAKSRGVTQFDFGRTERDNPGLLAFKNQWVANPKRLVYWRYPNPSVPGSATNRKWNLTRSVFALVPDRLQVTIGKFLYPHIG